MNGNKSVKSTNILILGLGGVGYYLAKRLAHEGYAITAIEPDGGMIRHADGDIDARLIQGNAMSIECWREVGAGKMDYLIAVTNNDAVNMMSCLIGDRFGIPLKIARVRSTEFGGEDSMLNASDLKIDLIIHPEELAAQEIFRLIKLRAGNDIIDVAGGQIQAMAMRIHEESPLAYRKLQDISKEYREFPFRVVAIARGITTLIPSGEDELLPQDQVFFMAGNENLGRLMGMTGVEQQKRHRVMIIGGGAGGSNGLCHSHEFSDCNTDEHRPGIRGSGPVRELCLYFGYGQMVSILEHARRKAGNVFGPGHILPFFLEAVKGLRPGIISGHPSNAVTRRLRLPAHHFLCGCPRQQPATCRSCGCPRSLFFHNRKDPFWKGAYG